MAQSKAFLNRIRRVKAGGPSRYYKHVEIDSVINCLGDYNPTHTGRPKRSPMILLNAAAGPYRPPPQAVHLLKSGLVWSTPFIPHKYGARFNLTPAGYALLDHWRDRFPSFVKFHDAYVRPKRRREADEKCELLKHGALPDDMRELLDLGKKVRETLRPNIFTKMPKHIAHCSINQWLEDYKNVIDKGKG